MIVALLAGLMLGATAEECPATLELKGRDVKVAAQSYADCMSRPHLPTASTLDSRKKQCAAKRRQNSESDPTVIWIDHIAATFPACETRLRIIRR
ncbi:hypothetical protein [Sphingomonas koreensis]